jgi:hypothetical protein
LGWKSPVSILDLGAEVVRLRPVPLSQLLDVPRCCLYRRLGRQIEVDCERPASAFTRPALPARLLGLLPESLLGSLDLLRPALDPLPRAAKIVGELLDRTRGTIERGGSCMKGNGLCPDHSGEDRCRRSLPSLNMRCGLDRSRLDGDMPCKRAQPRCRALQRSWIAVRILKSC